MPGGSLKTVYKLRKPKVAKCAVCGHKLKGIPRLRPYKAKSIAKTKKRPERPYGGYLCSKCLRESIKQKLMSN